LDVDLYAEPIGTDADGQPVFLREIWPSDAEIATTLREALQPEVFSTRYADVFAGDARWQAVSAPTGDRYAWSDDSTYIRKAPYFDGMSATPAPVTDVVGARVLAVLGDSVTTDHISPAGSIKRDGPA